MLAVDAEERRVEPFVILILDLRDEFAKNIAIATSSRAEVDRQIDLSNLKGVLPCLLFDTTEHDADVFLEKTKNWHSFKNSVQPNNAVRVIIVGDGGVSFGIHSIPG